MVKHKRRHISQKTSKWPFIAIGVIATVLLSMIVVGLISSSEWFSPKAPSKEIQDVQSTLDTLKLPQPDVISVDDNGCTGSSKPYCFWAISYRYNNADSFWPGLKDELMKNWEIKSDNSRIMYAENKRACLIVSYKSGVNDGKNTGDDNEGSVRVIYKGSNGCQ